MKTVTVRSVQGHDLTVIVDDGRHEITADEPEADGGEDLGPSPYELLLASLGACKVITLFLYARRKQWPLESVAIHLTHEKLHPRDCPECTPEEIATASPAGRIDVIRSEITVTGPLDAGQVARLLEISERCPVNRTLQTPPKLLATMTLG